jgi:hypothetical protein
MDMALLKEVAQGKRQKKRFIKTALGHRRPHRKESPEIQGATVNRF